MSDRGYEWIREQKREKGLSLPNLLALSRQYDPWYCGSPEDWKKARWFLKAWQRLGFENQRGIHLRRMHYAVQAHRLKNLKGKPYQLSEQDWDSLLECSRCARHLGLIAADVLDDRRNGEPEHVVRWEPTAAIPQVIYTPRLRFTPEFHLAVSCDWKLPEPLILGYDAEEFLDRRYLCEIWIEKSTANDLLLPICRELQIALVTGVGFQSITSAVRFLQRAEGMGKPARIFYISDHDLAGKQMPMAVSRQLGILPGEIRALGGSETPQARAHR